MGNMWGWLVFANACLHLLAFAPLHLLADANVCLHLACPHLRLLTSLFVAPPPLPPLSPPLTPIPASVPASTCVTHPSEELPLKKGLTVAGGPDPNLRGLNSLAAYCGCQLWEQEQEGGTCATTCVILRLFFFEPKHLDDRQIAHLVCVRIKHVLYDFFGDVLGLCPVVFPLEKAQNTP